MHKRTYCRISALVEWRTAETRGVSLLGKKNKEKKKRFQNGFYSPVVARTAILPRTRGPRAYETASYIEGHFFNLPFTL